MDHDEARSPARGDVVIRATTGSLDDGLAVEVELMIPGPSRGREGAIELVVRSSGLTFTGERVVWLVTTNKGWLHLRGVGRLDGGPPAPFRCDLFSSAMVRADGPDLMVLRIYDAQADPNHDGPVAKLRAALGAGSVQLGPGFRSTSGAERSGRP